MQAKFTPEDLLRFIYGEVNPEEHMAISSAIESSERLYQTYQEMLSVVGSLEKLELEPDPSTIDIIMEHSQFLEEPQF